MQATITSKGQITIPKKLRNHLNLSTGDKVEFVLDKKTTKCKHNAITPKCCTTEKHTTKT